MNFLLLSRCPRLFTVLGALLVITVTSACDLVSVQPRPPAPTATQVLPTPTPASARFAPPPTDCPASPPLDTLTATVTDPGFSGPVELVGRAPVWAPSMFLYEGPYALSQPTSADPWPAVKIMWQIGPKSYPKVTVRAYDLKTGDLAWWEIFSNTGPTTPVLAMDPTGEAHGTVRFDWAEYRTGLVVGHAGCYKVDVTWPGGEWYIILAVGGDSSP
jgi:hypothetical protein